MSNMRMDWFFLPIIAILLSASAVTAGNEPQKSMKDLQFSVGPVLYPDTDRFFDKYVPYSQLQQSSLFLPLPDVTGQLCRSRTIALPCCRNEQSKGLFCGEQNAVMYCDQDYRVPVGSTKGFRIVQNRDEPVVIDKDSGLTWQGSKIAFGLSWSEAIDWCGHLDYAGHSDWRLPNIHELLSILDCRKRRPSIDLTLFPETPYIIFWSSTSCEENLSNGWFVGFCNGKISYDDKTCGSAVRCVRP